MRIERTPNVEHHQINDNYDCILVHFEDGDALWFKNSEQSIQYCGRENTDFSINWMPRFDEILEINRILFEIDPEFRSKLKDQLLGPADYLLENTETEGVVV